MKTDIFSTADDTGGRRGRTEREHFRGEKVDSSPRRHSAHHIASLKSYQWERGSLEDENVNS